MDIAKLIEIETANERALWDALKRVEDEMAPMETRKREACATWCRSKERLDALKLAKSITDAGAPVKSASGDDAPHGQRCAQRMHTAAECTCGKADAAALGDDAAVLDADRRELDDGAVYRVKPSGELERLP